MGVRRFGELRFQSTKSLQFRCAQLKMARKLNCLTGQEKRFWRLERLRRNPHKPFNRRSRTLCDPKTQSAVDQTRVCNSNCSLIPLSIDWKLLSGIDVRTRSKKHTRRGRDSRERTLESVDLCGIHEAHQGNFVVKQPRENACQAERSADETSYRCPSQDKRADLNFKLSNVPIERYPTKGEESKHD